MKWFLLIALMIAAGLWFWGSLDSSKSAEENTPLEGEVAGVPEESATLPQNEETGEVTPTTTSETDNETVKDTTESPTSPPSEETVSKTTPPTQSTSEDVASAPAVPEPAPTAEEPVAEEIPPPAEPEEEPAPQLPLPEVTFTASDIIIENGDPVTLTWDVKNADSCKTTGFLAYGAMSGELKFNPSQNYTYTIDCTGGGGEVKKSVEVAVVSVNSIGVVLQASATDVESDAPVTLSWGSMNASTCSGTEFNVYALSGKVTVTPDATTRYTINCSNSTSGGSAEDSVLVTVTEATESGPPDSSPPVISNGLPTGTIFATTSADVTLSVTTDEDATCKYSLFTGTQFSQMHSFSPTGGTEHSASVSDLPTNATYRYYVRCEDEAQNQNTSDYIIQFTIGSP